MNSNNPYQAPQSQVADLPEPGKPREIKLALLLIWISLIAGTIYGVWSTPLSPEEEDAILSVYIFSAVMLGIWALPVIFISLGHGWARWLWLFLMALGWAATFWYWEDHFDTPFKVLCESIFAAIDLTGLYLLFFSPGARWFKRDSKVGD